MLLLPIMFARTALVFFRKCCWDVDMAIVHIIAIVFNLSLGSPWSTEKQEQSAADAMNCLGRI